MEINEIQNKVHKNKLGLNNNDTVDLIRTIIKRTLCIIIVQITHKIYKSLNFVL